MWHPQSEAVGDSAYGSGWIGSGYCQTLRIMMMRARIPNKITAAKFYAMSLESFSAVNNKMKRKCRSAVLNERFLMLTRISLCYLLREWDGRSRTVKVHSSWLLVYFAGSEYVVLVLHGSHSHERRVMGRTNERGRFTTLRRCFLMSKLTGSILQSSRWV